MRTRWFGIVLDVIDRPNEPQIVHDHPWWSWRLVLAGRYLEQMRPNKDNPGWEVFRWRAPGTAYTIKRQAAHCVIRLGEGEPVLALIVTGRVRGGWGFWPGGHKISWQNYRALDTKDREHGAQPWETITSIPGMSDPGS